MSQYTCVCGRSFINPSGCKNGGYIKNGISITDRTISLK